MISISQTQTHQHIWVPKSIDYSPFVHDLHDINQSNTELISKPRLYQFVNYSPIVYVPSHFIHFEWILQALLSENSYCRELSKSSTNPTLDLHFYSCTYIILGQGILICLLHLNWTFPFALAPHKVLRTSTSLQWIMGSQSWTLNLLSLIF
jgi:hypothetical protein